MPRVMGSPLNAEELEFMQTGVAPERTQPYNVLKITETEFGPKFNLNGKDLYNVDPHVIVDAEDYIQGAGAKITMTLYAKVEME